MTLLYQTAEWHGLAKLCMHTESSLELLESLTEEFGLLMQNFQELTSSDFLTMELPKEIAAINRKEARNTGPSQSGVSQVAVAAQPAPTTGGLEEADNSAPQIGTPILPPPANLKCRL